MLLTPSLRNKHRKVIQKLQEELFQKQKENNYLENEIKNCQTEIIRILRDEISALKDENKELLIEVEKIRNILPQSKTKISRKNTKWCLVELEKIRTTILFGKAPTKFQRFDN